ncbi:MAG: hypothetical protein QXV32_05160 [Conexivisphaerales archaeon]
MRSLEAIQVLLFSFAVVETWLSVLSLTAGSALGPNNYRLPAVLSFFWRFAPHLSISTWAAFGLTVWLGRSARNSFVRSGFDDDIYELMVKMKGSGSRVLLLRNLEEPKHRFDLANSLGLDWKEVDRQLNILQKYGLVSVAATSGSVRMYKITEQGRALIKLIDAVAGKRT